MKIPFYIAIVILLFITGGCKDDDDKPRFEGIILTDAMGSKIGTKGSRDLNDWQQDASLPERIITVMNSTVTEDLMTDTKDAQVKITGYPNPCAHVGSVYFNIQGGPCLLKIVVVDQAFNVKYQSAEVTGSTDVNFDLSDQNEFPNRSIVRVYYSLSHKDEDHFYVGHGDFLICRDGECLK